MDIEQVEIDKLVPHPDNPRRGDLETIANSLRVHGQYKPLVVQRSTGYILAGNHTWLAAKHLGWDTLAVAYVDVGETQASQILLVDNRASDLGSYDNVALSELLASLDTNLEGTGYDPDYVDDLLAALDAMPVLAPTDTGAAYAETPAEIHARQNSFTDAVPRAALGTRDVILVGAQVEFAEFHTLLKSIKDAYGNPELSAMAVALVALRAAHRAATRCNGDDECAWCSQY